MPNSRGIRMSWKLARRMLAAVVALILAICGAGFALLYLPALEGARSRIAAELLATYLGEAVAVNGGVDVTVGRTIDVAVQGIVPGATTSGAAAPPGRVRMSFSREAALRGQLLLTALDLGSIRVVIDAAAAVSSNDSLGERVSGAVQRVLSSPLVRSLKLQDVRILRINDPEGWNGSLIFDAVTARETDRAGAVAIEARGSLNGQPFTLSGQVPDLSPTSGAARGGSVALSLALKEIDARLDGRLAQDGREITVSARLGIRSQSLGDVQDVLKLARVLEGTGTLGLALNGALAKLAIDSAKLRIQDADGRVYKVEGELADMWAIDGVDLRFAATLVPPDALKGTSRFDLAPRSIEGRVSNRAKGFDVDNVMVETGLAAIELKKVGPIRVGKIARDENGRLRLEDIRLVQGDPKDPILDLTGNLNDALALEDFSLAGSFRLGMAGMLTGRHDVADVGALRGKVAMSDASGHLRLERLSAKLDGTDLMSLSVRLVASDKRGTRVGLKLNVPELGHLASAIGHTASANIQIGFDGTIGIADGAATVEGSARVGKTDLHGRLRIAAPKGKPEIIGSIRAKDLRLDDLIAAHEASELFTRRKIDAVKLREDVQNETKLSLDIAADAVEGDEQKADGLSAHLVYSKPHLRISPVDIAYLGGHVKGGFDADFAHSPPALKLEAEGRRLSLARLLKRLDKAPAASGPLDFDLEVTAKGEDFHTLLASLNGQAWGSIQRGSLADRTINLAGQNIVDWVFTRAAGGGAPLLCFVARFDFKDGIGAARELVLETDKVQAVGGGTLNLRNETMSFVFMPRPKQDKLVGEVGPVDVRGPLSKPEIKLADGAVAAKVVGDTIGLPFHVLGSILGTAERPSPEHQPCVVVPDRE